MVSRGKDKCMFWGYDAFFLPTGNNKIYAPLHKFDYDRLWQLALFFKGNYRSPLGALYSFESGEDVDQVHLG